MPQQTDTKQLRIFGMGFCVILSIFAGISFWKGSFVLPWVLLLMGSLFGFFGMVAPFALEFMYHPWMMFAEKLAWFNTRLLLGIVFFVIITPIGLCMRLISKDPMERRWIGSTYWTPARTHSQGNKHFERQS